MAKKSEDRPIAHVLLTTKQRDELRALKQRLKHATDSQAFEYVWGMYEIGRRCVGMALKEAKEKKGGAVASETVG